MTATFTELFPGVGGSKMDESLVSNTPAGGTAHRANVVPGGADGTLQTFTNESGLIKADVKDASAVATLASILSTLASLLTELGQKTEPADQQHVIVDSGALPTGAATEATLAAIKATLDLVKAKTDNLDVALSTRTKPLDQQHVIVDSGALPSGATTESTLASVLTELGQKTEPADQQHVIVDSGALPAGAATEVTLAAIKAKTDNIDVALSTRTKPADQQHVIVDSGALPTGAATEATLARRHNLFASLMKAEADVGQEIRLDDGESDAHLYIGRAANGTATSAASWEVVKYTRDASGKTQRAQYRTAVVWDSRTTGW